MENACNVINIIYFSTPFLHDLTFEGFGFSFNELQLVADDF